jgi:carboxy-cis,cis-muconate cyclase
MKFLAALVFASGAIAAKHHLFTSSLSTPHLYSLEFDDETNSLVDIANITAHGGHPWLSFSYDKSNIYAGERNGFASYIVLNSTGLEYNRSISLAQTCGDQRGDSSVNFLIAELRAPYSVFGAPYGTCGAAVGVDLEGNLQGVVQNVPFATNSRVSGMTLDPENKFLYSADEDGRGIWTHSVDEKGQLTQVAFTATPRAGSGPRHLVIHPTGKYLYAVLSKSNHVITYAIQSGPTAATQPLKSTTTVYSLLPKGKQSQNSRLFSACSSSIPWFLFQALITCLQNQVWIPINTRPTKFSCPRTAMYFLQALGSDLLTFLLLLVLIRPLALLVLLLALPSNLEDPMMMMTTMIVNLF